MGLTFETEFFYCCLAKSEIGRTDDQSVTLYSQLATLQGTKCLSSLSYRSTLQRP
jgi:hypothetical protein